MLAVAVNPGKAAGIDTAGMMSWLDPSRDIAEIPTRYEAIHSATISLAVACRGGRDKPVMQ